MIKYKYNINNLDCANCAREIEENLNKNDKFNNVIVNFSTGKISYETEYDISLKELNDLVQKIEPDVTVTRKEVKTEKGYSFVPNEYINRAEAAVIVYNIVKQLQ